MARTEVYKEGVYISLPVATGTESGDPVQIGDLVGVAQTDEGDIDNGGTNLPGYASIALNGAWRVPTAVATTIGAKLYITSAGVINTTATSNKLFGYALSAKSAGAGTVIAKLVQS